MVTRKGRIAASLFSAAADTGGAAPTPDAATSSSPARWSNVDKSASNVMPLNTMSPVRKLTWYVGRSSDFMLCSSNHDTRPADTDLSDEGIDGTFRRFLDMDR